LISLISLNTRYKQTQRDMIKFTRSTKKKIDKVRHPSNSNGRSHSRGPADGRSVSSAYSTHSTRSDYTDGNSYANANNGGGGSSNIDRSSRRHKSRGGTSVASSTGGSRRFSSAQSVASISSASVFAPSVATVRVLFIYCFCAQDVSLFL